MDFSQDIASTESSLLAGVRGATQNYYEILGVSPDASRMEIRSTYLRAKMAYSSQSQALYSLVSDEAARESLALVEEAFRVLGDEGRRADYDRMLSAARRAGGATNVEVGNDALVSTFAASAPMRAPQSFVPTTAARASGEEIRTAVAAYVAEGDPADGAFYRKLRELIGISEAEIHERTKISLSQIRALEENRYEELPQQVFVKGFLRSILRYMNIPDAEKLTSAYGARFREWQLTNNS